VAELRHRMRDHEIAVQPILGKDGGRGGHNPFQQPRDLAVPVPPHRVHDFKCQHNYATFHFLLSILKTIYQADMDNSRRLQRN
jgi:hypothetical protein